MEKCVLYLAAVGILFFIVGRLLPGRWLHADRFPFRAGRFEEDGRFYERLKIRSWQNKLPDMSRIFPGVMPAKQLSKAGLLALPDLIQETCVAEATHAALCVAGLYCLRLWRGMGGRIIVVCNLLGNIPFIMIQRYNRPRLMRLLADVERRRSRKERFDASTDLELQYR